MSRVTIEGLYDDFTVPGIEAREYGTNYEQYVALAGTEIVPRKIVEMIIEKCEKDICTDYKADAAIAEASLIKRYAEELLEQFEEDK